LGAFYGKQMEAFHEDVVEKCRQNNTLRLYSLTIQNKIVAVIYAIKHHGVLNYYATGYDQQFGKYGVGRQLFSFMVAQAIAEGVSELDLLRGDETYKFQWVADKRTDSNVWVGCGWKGKLILSLRQLFTRQAITPLALSAT
jgi:CelD/BcsL family acetyltransferase involved in cellulose biosynthesis